MSGEGVSNKQPTKYAFVVYDPPEPGMPWLAVCIDPTGNILGAEAFDNRLDAQAKTTKCAQDFLLRFFEDGRMKPSTMPSALH